METHFIHDVYISTLLKEKLHASSVSFASTIDECSLAILKQK